jgi:hypothetical protein
VSRRHGDWHVLGSVYDRRRRVEWMIETFGIARKGDGKKTRIKCHHCPRIMRAESLRMNRYTRTYESRRNWEIDRFPVCGHDGGRYVRGNIVPSCKQCNVTRCTKAIRCRLSAPALRASYAQAA